MKSARSAGVVGSTVCLLACWSAFAAPADRETRLADAYRAIERVLADSPLPGLVVGITDRTSTRKIIVQGYADLKTRRRLTADSHFAIGSVSKGFTAIALMELMDDGRFDPNAPVSRYLPEFSIRSTFPPITGRDLLSHTAGLPNYLVDASSSRYVMEKLHDFVPRYAPGAHWWYSNTGFQVLGYALENIDKDTYPVIIRQRILQRLGMTSTTAVIDDQERRTMPISYIHWAYDDSYVEAPWFEYTAGDGSVLSNASDMCSYLRLILNRGAGPTGRLLSEKAFSALTSPVLNGYAYGFHVRTAGGTTVVAHTGGIAGFSSEIEAHLEDGFGIVFLSNGGIDPAVQSWIVDTIAAAYHGDKLPPAPDVRHHGTDLGQYAGVFGSVEDPNGAKPILEFAVVDDKLAAKEAGNTVALTVMGTDVFRDSRPGSGREPYYFSRQGGQITDVSQGAAWYVRKGAALQLDRAAPSYEPYVGHFENNGPEGWVARVFVRNGHLMAALRPEGLAPQALQPTGEQGVFRLTEPDYAPEEFRFDTPVNGHSLRLEMTGVPMYRKDTP